MAKGWKMKMAMAVFTLACSLLYFTSSVQAQIPYGNTTCLLALYDMGENISSSHFLMRDATGKGLFGVNVAGKVIMDPGMWDQCLRVPNNEANYCVLKSSIGEVVLDNATLPLAIGACLPSVCNASELQEAGWINIARAGIDIPFPMALGSLSVKCYEDQNEIELGNMVVLSLIAVLLLLTLLGTCIDVVVRSRLFESFIENSKYDNAYMNLSYIDYRTNEEDESILQAPSAPSTYHRHAASKPKGWILSLRNASTNSTNNEGEGVEYGDEELFDTPQNQKIALMILRVFLSWSLISNFKALFDDKRASLSTPLRFSFLNGVRVLSMAWIIFGYTCYYLPMMTWFNVEHLSETEEDFLYQLAVNSSLFGIDVFFIISGLLSIYNAIEAMKEKPAKPEEYLKEYPKFINVFLFILRRLVRLTPSLIIAVLFYWKVVKYLSDGPMWGEYISRITEQCDAYWWASSFYLSSFYPSYILDLYVPVWGCVSWSWYLSCEIIFLLLSPIILFAFYKKKWIGFWLTLLLILVTIFTGFLLALLLKLSPGFGHQVEEANFDDFGNMYYNKPYTRAPAYLLGVLMALILQSVRYVRIPPIVRVITYLVVWSSFTFLFFISFTAYQSEEGWEEWANILFVAFAHPLFSILSAVTIILMAYGYEGPLNLRRFFGSSLWVPYSRVTYGVYLYAPMIIEMTYASAQVSRAYTLYEVFFHFFGFMVISYLAGLLNYLIVEVPFLRLYDILVPIKR